MLPAMRNGIRGRKNGGGGLAGGGVGWVGCTHRGNIYRSAVSLAPEKESRGRKTKRRILPQPEKSPKMGQSPRFDFQSSFHRIIAADRAEPVGLSKKVEIRWDQPPSVPPPIPPLQSENCSLPWLTISPYPRRRRCLSLVISEGCRRLCNLRQQGGMSKRCDVERKCPLKINLSTTALLRRQSSNDDGFVHPSKVNVADVSKITARFDYPCLYLQKLTELSA